MSSVIVNRVCVPIPKYNRELWCPTGSQKETLDRKIIVDVMSLTYNNDQPEDHSRITEWGRKLPIHDQQEDPCKYTLVIPRT